MKFYSDPLSSGAAPYFGPPLGFVPDADVAGFGVLTTLSVFFSALLVLVDVLI